MLWRVKERRGEMVVDRRGIGGLPGGVRPPNGGGEVVMTICCGMIIIFND